MCLNKTKASRVSYADETENKIAQIWQELVMILNSAANASTKADVSGGTRVTTTATEVNPIQS